MEKRNVAGIIAEYNPFHNGHAHLIRAVRAAGATHIAVIMSGNYVLVGEAACMDKFIRAKAAIACGVDLILELPLPYAMATAERFSCGAVFLMHALGIDMLAFGSECGDVKRLDQIATILDTSDCSSLTKKLLETGIPYASARQQAVVQLCNETDAALLSSPNNTLAIEYLRQLNKQKLSAFPFTIKRGGVAHDSHAPNDAFASASFLRKTLSTSGLDSLASYIPAPALQIYRTSEQYGDFPFQTHIFDISILCTLRSMDLESILSLPDISEGLGHRLYGAVQRNATLDDVLSATKTKRYSLARIRRLVWYAFLGVSADMMYISPPYMRILAMNENGAQLLKRNRQILPFPISASLRELERLGGNCARYTRLEAKTTDLYLLGLPSHRPCGEDYRHRIQKNITSTEHR